MLDPVSIIETKLLNILLVLLSGNSLTAATPLPAKAPTLGSIGIVPKKGSFDISAKDFPPPVENMFVHSLHVGHS